MSIELITSSENELVLDLNSLNGKTECDLTYRGTVIGHIKRVDNSLSIDIQNSSMIRIRGADVAQSVDIKASGELALDSAMDLHTLTIQCQQLQVNNKISASAISLSGNTIKNNGKLLAQLKLTIRAKQFIDQGECRSDKKISIKVEDFTAETSSAINSEGILKIKSESWLSKGKIISKEMACLDAKDVNHQGDLTLPSLAMLHANNFTMLPGGHLNVHGDQNRETHARVKIDDTISIKKNSIFKMNDAALEARKLKISGEVQVEHSRVTTDKLKSKKKSKSQFNKSSILAKNKLKSKHQSELMLNNSRIDTENLLLADQSEQTTENSVLKAKKAILTDNSKLTATQSELYAGGYQTTENTKVRTKKSKIAANIIKTEGTNNYHQSLIQSDFYTDGSKSTLDESKLNVSKSYDQSSSADTVMGNQSNITVPRASIKGKAALKDKSSIMTTTLAIDGDVKAEESHVKAKLLNESKTGKVRLEKSAVFSENIIAKGLVTSHEGHIETNDFLSEGTLNVNQSNLLVKNRSTLKNQTALNHTNVESKYINLDGNFQIENSEVQCLELQQQGQGTFRNNRIKTDRYALSRAGLVNYEGNQLNAKDYVVAGTVVSSESTVKANHVFQDHGVTSLSKSRLEAANLMFSQSDSSLNADSSFLASKDAGFENRVQLKTTCGEFEVLDSKQSLQMQDSRLTASNRIKLEGETRAQNSLIESKDRVDISGNLSSQSSRVTADSQMVVNREANVLAGQSQFKAQSFQNIGEVEMTGGSELRVDTVADIYKKLKLDHSNIYANKTTIHTRGEMSATEALVKVADVENNNKLALEKAKVEAQNVRLQCGSQLVANQAMIEAKNSVNVETDSRITGESLAIKTTEFENMGNATLAEALSIDADYAYNFGTLNGGNRTTITSNRLLLNFLGSVRGKDTTITAVTNLNLLSSIYGGDSLTVKSLLDFNGLGAYRGYNVSVNNVLGLNGGFVMPSFPNSWSAIFSSQHFMGVARAGLTTFIPGYSNLINFGFQATPMLASALPAIKNKGVRLYNAYKAGNLREELLPDRRLFGSDARLVDWIPTTLNTYNTAMMGYGLYQTYNAAQPEFQNLRTDFDMMRNTWSLDNSMRNFRDFNWTQLSSEANLSKLKDLSYATALALGPTQSVQSIINLNFGANFSNSVNQTGLININTGLSGATQAYNRTDYYYGSNRGLIMADRVTMTGRQLDQGGTIYGHDRIYVNYNDILSGPQSLWEAQNAVIFADHLKEQGKQRFGNLNGKVRQWEIAASGDANIQAGLLSTNTVIVDGKLTVNNFHLDNKDGVKIGAQGHLAADHSTLKTEHLNVANNGDVTLRQTNLDANKTLTLAEGSHLTATLGEIKTNKADLNGSVALQGVVVDANKLTTGSQSNLKSQSATVEIKKEDGTRITAQQSTIIKTNNTTLNGNTDLANTALNAKEKLTIAGTMHTNQSALQAHTLKVAKTGSLDASQTAVTADSLQVQNNAKFVKSDLNITHGTTVAKGAKVEANQTHLKTENFTNSGEVNLADCVVKAKGEIDVKKGGNVKADRSTVGGKKLTAAGNVEFNESHVHLEERINVAPQGHLTANQSIIEAQEMNNFGKVNLSQSETNIVGDINNHAGGQFANHQSNVNAHHFNNLGSLDSKASTMNLSGRFVQDKDADSKLVETHLTAAHSVSIDGKLKMDKAHIESKRHVTFAETADVKAKNSVVTGDSVHQNGHLEYAGYLGIKAKDKVVTGQNSSIESRGKPKDNLLDIEAKTADLTGGKAKVDNLNLAVDHLPGAENFISRKGKYANFVVSDNLTFETDDAINLSEPIKRDCGLDITGRSVTVHTDYKTTQDLHFRSTKGDVRLYSNLQSRNLSVESAQNLYTTQNINANKAIVLRANGYYDNVGGNVTADIVSCEADRVRNLSGGALKYSEQKKAQDEHYAKRHKHSNKEYEPRDPLHDLDANARAEQGSGGVIMGREVYLHARKSDIENYGGVVKGTDYLQGTAKRDIVNRCNVTETKGKHDLIKTYDKGVMGGGNGLNNDGIGMYLDAGRHVTNIGSSFISDGSNYIHAKKGFDSRTQHHTYVSKHKKESTWYGKKTEKTKTDTNLGIAEVVSTQGENIIIADKGQIYAEATHFLSKDGTKAYARDDIELYNLVYANKSSKKNGYLWGAISSSSKEYHEYAEPVRIYDHGISVLKSKKGNIICRGLVAEGNGDFYTSAKKGSVDISSQKLQHSIHEQSKSFGVSLPMYDRMKGMAENGGQGILMGFDPTMQKINALIDSNDSRQFFANSWNTAVSGYNSYQNIMFAQQNGILSQYATQQFNIGSPSLDFSFNQSDLRVNYESQGPGHIHRANWYIEAGNDVNIRGVDVNIAGDMSVRARRFNLEGHELHSHTRAKQDSVTIGVGAQGVNHVGGSHQSSSVRETHFNNQQNYVGGTLNLEVDQMNMRAANIDAGDIQGHVRELNVVSPQDVVVSKQKSVSFDSNGQGSYQESRDVTRQINQASGMHVRNGINHDDQHKFTVNKTTLEGAKITSDGVNNFASEVVVSKEVKDYHKQRSVAVSGSLNDVVRVIAPEENESAQRPNTLAVVSVATSSTDQAAVQRGTIHGAQGTGLSSANIIGALNTKDSHGYEQTKNKHREVSLDIPVVDAITPLRQRLAELHSKDRDVAQSDLPLADNNKNQSVPVAERPVPAAETPVNDSPAPAKMNDTIPAESGAVSPTPLASDSIQAIQPQVAAQPPAAATHHRDFIGEKAAELGLKVLGVAYEEVGEFLKHESGGKGAAGLFTGLGLGITYTENLIYAKEHGSPNPEVDAMIYTAIGVPNLLVRWFVKIPLDVTANLQAGPMEKIEKNNFEDFSSELGKKYWNLSDEEQLRLGFSLEDMQRPTMIEYYGMAKAVEFASQFDKKIGNAALEWWRSGDKKTTPGNNSNAFFHNSGGEVKSSTESTNLQPGPK